MVVGIRRVRAAALVAAAAMVVSLGVAGGAQAAVLDPGAAAPTGDVSSAAGALPVGWALANDVLTWSSPERIPMGGARTQVVLDGRDLGQAVVATDRRSVSVRLSPGAGANPTIDWSGLAVLASGRRLDAGSLQPLQARTTGPAAALATPPPGDLLAHDPGKAGPYRTVTGTYSLPGVSVAGLPELVEVKAVVVSPSRHHRSTAARPVPARPARDLLPRGRRVDR